MNRSPSLLLAGLLIALTGSVRAEVDRLPTLKVGSVTYTNVVVASKNPTDIFILHKGGVTNLKLKDLDPETQKLFAYDREKADALEKKRTEEMSDYQVALGAAAAKKAAATPPKEIWAKNFLGQKTPELVVQKWLGATPEIEGKFLLVTFWATTSAPSLKALPLLNSFHQKFSKDLVVIALSDENEETVRALTEPPIEFFSGIDPEEKTLKAAEVKALPHALLIDPSGIVRWEGFPSLEGHELTESVIQELLGKVSK